MDKNQDLIEKLSKSLVQKISQKNTENTENTEQKKKIFNAFGKVFKREANFSSLFEGVKDYSFILQVQRKIFNFATYGFIISLILNLILFIAIFFILLPLKEKEPYLVTFNNAEQNFAIVQKADSSITANEALKRQLIGAYIIARETINRINDADYREKVRNQSSRIVWRQYEALIADKNSIYTNGTLTRSVKIVNISLKNKTYATADVEITLYVDGKVESIKRYIISLIYKFEPLSFDFKSLPINPTGFIVEKYAMTSVDALKELPKENRVNRNTIISKIIKTQINDEEQVLKDAYLYQVNKKDKEEKQEKLNQTKDINE